MKTLWPNPQRRQVPSPIRAAVNHYLLKLRYLNAETLGAAHSRRANPLLLPLHPSPLQMEIRPAGWLAFRVSTDYSPARSGGLFSAPPCSGSPSPAQPKSAQGGCHSGSITDCSPARSCGLLPAPPCSPSPAPPKSAPGGCHSWSITDCSPARSCGLLSAQPCSPSPAPAKPAPVGCHSESITDYNLTLLNNHSLSDPPCSSALVY